MMKDSFNDHNYTNEPIISISFLDRNLKYSGTQPRFLTLLNNILNLNFLCILKSKYLMWFFNIYKLLFNIFKS